MKTQAPPGGIVTGAEVALFGQVVRATEKFAEPAVIAAEFSVIGSSPAFIRAIVCVDPTLVPPNPILAVE